MKPFLLISMAIFVACSQERTFVNFDQESWQKDKMACGEIRTKMAADFENIRRELLGFSQDDIIDVLGKPDLQLLQGRSQKFYVYFIETGSQCEGKTGLSQARTVSVRFNALGLATEIIYADGKPV